MIGHVPVELKKTDEINVTRVTETQKDQTQKNLNESNLSLGQAELEKTKQKDLNESGEDLLAVNLERAQNLQIARMSIKQNMPPSYDELLRSKRAFWGDSKEMDLVKKTLKLAGDAVQKENIGEAYSAEDLDGIIKLYNDAIDACNFYVNNSKKNKSNRRYALVKENLNRLSSELTSLDQIRTLIKNGEADGKASSVLELIQNRKEQVREGAEKINEEKKEEPGENSKLVVGGQYTFRIYQKYRFKRESFFGRSAERSIQNRKSYLDEIPKDLTQYDQGIREDYELIKKWAESEPLKGKWLKDINDLKKQENESGSQIYQNLDRLKASEEEKIREMALKLEVMMKGKLKVDLNDNNTVDLSDKEDLFKECFEGSQQQKSVEIDGLTERRNEPLFLHEPNVADIRQGNVGDCYFMSALAVLLERDPDYIRKNMADLGDKVAVRFANFGNPKTVIVQKTTMKEKGTDKDVGATESPLWVRMMEKAYSLVLAGWVDGCDGNQRIAALSQTQSVVDKNTGGMFSLIRSGNPYNALDAGGHANSFISFFAEKNYSGEYSLTGFHKAAISLDSLAEKARSRMKGEDVPALHGYYDKKIKQWVDEKFTRTKVKTYSEYLDALDHAEKTIKDDKTTLADYPVNGVQEEEKKEGFLKYIKSLREQGKKDNRILNADHSLVGEGAYTKDELSLFRELEKADNEKKFVSIQVRREHKFVKRKKRNRNMAEDESGGFYTRHEYAFMGVRRLNENGRERLFVVLRNPWGDMVRIYSQDGRAKLMSNTTEAMEEYAETDSSVGKIQVRREHVDTNGVFHMELRDFLNMANFYRIEK